MKILRLFMQFAAVIMLFIILACASTKFTAIWKDETYQGHPEKILVINAFPNPANRKLFEDEFVKALKDRGTDAVVSYTVMPDPIVSDKDNIADEEACWRCIQEVGADTVLINKPLGKPKGEPSGSEVITYLNMQTDVYDMKSNRLILSATEKSQIQSNKPYSALIKPYIEDLVSKLSQQGLLKKR